MKHSAFKKMLSAMLALVLCIGMVPATAISVAAASSVGSNEWVVRNDDFSRYPTGTDTFWKNAWYGGFTNGSHGAYGSESYATYDIVEENGNKMLQMVTVNPTDTAGERTPLNANFTMPTVSGAWSLSMEFCMVKPEGGSVPGLSISMLSGISPSLPGSVTVYVEPTKPYGVRLVHTVTGSTQEQHVQGADGKMVINYDTWYTLELSVEAGKFMVKAWPQGQEKPADDATTGVIVLENECFTQERLNGGMAAIIQGRGREDASLPYKVRLDNLKITKPYDTMTLPALSGAVGDVLSAIPTFTGQDLMAQQPKPKFSYTVTDSTLGRATPGGYLALNAEGTGTVTAKLLDIDGNETNVTASAALTVAASTAAEQPLRILSIGNDYSCDTLYYVDELAALMGKDVESAYLSMTDATLRYHAHNVAQNTADYSYYADAAGDTATTSAINDVVEGERWDIIMLQQGGAAVGMNNTFAGDLRYLLDYLADAQPNAEVYWNMNAAEGSGDTLVNYYDNSQNVMYNAIVGCLDMFIVGEDAQYANDFDGWFPVGAAIQNLRAAKGDTTLTSETENSRLAAAMTVLTVLFPEDGLDSITAETLGITDADLSLIRQSAEDACANLSAAPTKLTVSPETIETASGDPDQVTVGQTDAPLNLRFADIVVTKDGTVYAGAYESVTHVPAREKLPYTQYCPEGYGRLKIWKGSADGTSWDFDNPILTIDQQELQDWGISPNLYNRYELLKTGVQDYAFLNDARDANLGLMYYDMDGNGTEDEVLLFTFFCNDYNESGSSTFTGTHLLFSIDGGETWSKPQRITSEVLGNGGGKRGDIAVFSDGQILFPMYAHPQVSGVLLQWNVATQHWDTIADTEIPNYVPEKTTDFTEPAFIAPNPDGNTVYSFVRDNGQAVISYDRGRSWEHIHTIDGEVLQPGWAYIDENRAFATWAFNNGSTRPTKGQMVYFDAGWEATQPVLIHEHYNRTPRDTGDPSSKLLQNGQLLAITYDTYFRSIVGKFLDPNAEQFLLPELSDDAATVTLQEVSGATNLTVYDLPDAHTLDFTVSFNNSSSSALTVTASNGAEVVLKVGEYGIKSTKNDYEVRIAVTNGATYVKAWRDGYLVPDWTAVEGGTSTNSGKAVFAGSGVTLGDVAVTRNVTMTMGEGGANTAGMGIAAPLQLNPADMADQVDWHTSDADVATVDAQGNISFVGMGNVTITATLGDKSVSADYTVGEATGEVTGAGETKVIFEDDFESYTAGDNTFYSAMTSNGYVTPSAQYAKTGYNIVEESGNQYLQLVGQEGNANYPWTIVGTSIFGDYTVQLDFQFDTGGVFFNMWHGNSIYSMVQIGTDHFNFQYKDAETGDYVNSPTFYSHEPGVWNTIKVARVDGGMYAKVWPTGTTEPANWQYNLLADEMNTDNTVQFRMSYSVQTEDSHSASFDNLIITKQTISDVGDKEWVVRNDDFEDRTVGTDAFWQDSKYTGWSSSYHKFTDSDGLLGSTIGGTVYYSSYNIIEENDNKMVELVSTYKVANYFKTADKVTGAYSATMDLYMPNDAYYATDSSKVPGVILDSFVGSDLAGVLPIYIDGKDGVRLRESVSTGTAQNHYITDANGTKMPFNLDSWYTVKVAVAPGQIMVKMWAKDEQEPAGDATSGVLVFNYDSITQALLNKGMSFSLATRARNSTSVSPTVRLDNLKIAKPYKSLSLPTQLSGAPGETVTLAPKFVGQDLADQTPVPTIRYTSSNSAAASVTAAGVVTYGDVGEATISVELLDIDGNSNGVAHEISVTVAEATEPEPEPEPDTGLEPEPDPEPGRLRGRFSLEVVNIVIINDEEVQICRWVWTPLDEQ